MHVFPAIIDSDGRKGCALSHRAVATIAHKSNPDDYALVFEDDALPAAAPDPQAVSNVISAIKSRQFDVLWLGGLPHWSHQKTAYPTIYAGSAWTTHALVLGPRAQAWLAAHEYAGAPIDVDLADECRKTLRGAWVHPSLFEQARSPSNVRRSVVSRTDLFGELLFQATPAWKSLVVHQRAVFAVCLFAVLLALLTQN